MQRICLACALALGLGGSAAVYAQAPRDTGVASGKEARRQQHEAGRQESQEAAQSGAEKSPEADSTEKYRHSAAVRYIASALHVSVETAADIFEYLNFAILAGTILYFLSRLIPKVFRGRREALEKQLLEARAATAEAKQRLSGVEARLGRLDDEIGAIRRQVEQDAVNDETRIKAALHEETQRIAAAAGHEVEAAGAAAQRDLRRFAAELAIDRATSSLSLTPEVDRRLVSDFAREITGDTLKGGRN